MKNLVTTNWLMNNMQNVRILDATWHMPDSKRNAKNEFLETHIDDANFIDLDKISDRKSPLPHMLSKRIDWEKIVSDFGIKNSDKKIRFQEKK